MKINQISDSQNFEGKLIVKNAINSQQKYLFNLHKSTLEKQIKDMPFDLFVEQSKSKKTVALSANVKDAEKYFVRKNEQNYEEIAGYAISDGMKKSEAYKYLVKANNMLNYIKLNLLNIFSGNFKEARESSKQLAKLGIKDFDIYKGIVNFKIINFPKEANKVLLKNSIKYRLYHAFSSKTPEEKQLKKMYKEYRKEMKAQNKEIKPTILDFSKEYHLYY